MAFIDESTDPNNPLNANQQQLNTQNPLASQPAPTTSSGSGPVTATGATTGSNVSNQVPGTNSPASPFQNIASYLSANQPQSAALGQTVASNVSGLTDTAAKGITAAGDAFAGNVASGFTPEDKSLITQVSTSPSEVVKSPDSVQKFQSLLTDQYTGPTDFTQSPSYNDLQTKVANATTTAANANTQEGMQTLVRGAETNPTAGITLLDNLLLSLNPDAVSAVKNAAGSASSLKPLLDSVTKSSNDAATAAATGAGQARTNSQTAIDTALKSLNDLLQKEQTTATGATTQYNTDVDALTKAAGGISQQIKDFLAANPQVTVTGNNDYLAPWLNLTPTNAPTLGSVARPEDYATLAALNTLVGGKEPISSPLDASTAPQAGTFSLPQDLQKAVQDGAITTAMANELGSIQNQITTAYAPFAEASGRADQGRTAFSGITGNAEVYHTINATNFPTLTDPTTGAKVPATITQQVPSGRGGFTTQTVTNPAWTALAQQASAFSQNARQADSDMRSMAPGLQWLPGVAQNYNDLIGKLSATLSPLSTMTVPTYATDTSGSNLGQDAEIAAMVANPIQAALPIAEANASNPLQLGAVLANPITTLTTLAIPQSVLSSIGNGITGVVNSIGNFFGNIF